MPTSKFYGKTDSTNKLFVYEGHMMLYMDTDSMSCKSCSIVCLAIKAGTAGVLGAYAVYSSFYSVAPGCRAIVFSRLDGIKEKVYPEGTHMVIPWLERPIIYDIRSRPQLVESTSGSHDLQMINIGLRVLFRPKVEELPRIYRHLGTDYDEKVLPSIIHETLKAVISQYNASQLLTQRENVSREIRKILTERASNLFMEVDDVSITSLNFGKEFTDSIEAKQIAQQDAERSKFVVEKAEQEKQAAIIRAQGEAKSARLIGQSVSDNQAFIALRHIEASKETAETLATTKNKVYISTDNLLIDLKSLNIKPTPSISF
ncbi:prohibitin-2, mitochondrial-like [Spinacia oleracea]|uniref:Prohibitin n=1 Tax=Spinacia oleracea TaxID=3562 RepID=A0ABM3QXB9_SPIOL|nr:prohibitin-2, mitochondrial-like [Spinacia oleracea]